MTTDRKKKPLVIDISAEEEELEEICRSIEKSRKRLLSPGVLRGDQAVDRLKEQEAGASPLLKKSRQSPQSSPRSPPAKMAMTMADFKAYMDANTNKKIDSQGKILSDLQATVRSVDQQVSKNTSAIELHSRGINENKNAIESLQAELRRSKSAKDDVLPGRAPAAASVADKEGEAFLRARRSLRIWPIDGNTVQDIWTSTGSFLREKLQLQHIMRDEWIESISRAEVPSGPGVKQEVVAVFSNSAYRDTVLGAVGKLAGCVDQDGKASAGIRVEVPGHLQPSFRTLFKYGQMLRARHGNGTRRHIKFDDASQTIFLNARLPGDSTWSRISTAVAKRELKAREVIADEEIERRFDITGPLAPRPRAVSLADGRMDHSPARRTLSISDE